MKRLTLFIVLIAIYTFLSAQNYHQTVRGTLVDKESHKPVEFATVIIHNTVYQQMTVSASDGSFRFTEVPVSRAELQVNLLGYENITLSNLDVTMGKELVLQIELSESTVKLDEVEVNAFGNKEKPLNSFAPISARTFSIEESQRYAGAGNDVCRMAMNFAGVKMSAETTNEIVIRGNSPNGLLFRLDGVDIPNPNHFGNGSETGGPVSMLNNNVLSNSDFLTGAFPAEYGNTISGIFDLRMRSGNSDKYEFLGQVSTVGYELGAEGPISGKNKSSYLINYRYSTLQLLSEMGMSVMGTAIPEYQDVCFKFNFPSLKFGTISIFGLGGKSSITWLDSERDTTEERQQMPYQSDYELDMYNDNYNGVVGITHTALLGTSAYTKLILSASTIRNYTRYDSLSIDDRHPVLQYHSDFQRTKYMATFYLNQKLNNKNTLRIGISAEIQSCDLLDSLFKNSMHRYITLRDFNGDNLLLQPYTQFQHRFSDRFRIDLGLHGMYQESNNDFSIEPRVGLKWEIANGSTLSFGYGLHSVTTPVEIIYQQVRLQDGGYTEPNLKLGFTHSQHVVLGYDKVFATKMRFKSEVYYQFISNAIIERNPGSYSLLNIGSYTLVNVDSLKNGGKGYNYGLELTLEKFMDHGMYFLTTLSLFDSKYQGSDGVWRNTAFNSNYVFNALGGKEFTLHSRKQGARYIKKLTLDGKFNRAGGQRYSPIDMEASRTAGITVYDDVHAFSKQMPAYARIDLRAGFKFIGRHSTQEIAININNLTNRKNPFYMKYDPSTGELKTIYQFGFMPDILYRISF
jgi:hypothetical protein